MKYHTTKSKVGNIREDVENRKDYIGGSDIGTIMGVNPWKSRYTLWAEKTGTIEPEDISDVEAVWWGTHLEDLVAERFTMKTGFKTRKSNYAYGVEEFPYLKGHVDRMASRGKFGLECKTTSSWNKTKYEDGEVPENHWWQCQFYMFVTGYDTWYLATKRDSQFYVTKINRDDEAIERMLEACQEFWNHVQNGEPVEIDGSESTAETIEQMYPQESNGDVVRLDEKEDTLIALQEINSQQKNLKELGDKYKNEIKAFMQTAERGETDQFYVYWKTDKRGTRTFRIKEKEV